MSITNWLEELGLGQYSAAFEAEAIDLETLPELKERDLVSMGVPIGHRKRIMRAIESNKISRAKKAPEAERRRLTVLFCDLVGSTKLSTKLDPEELRELLQAYREACASVVDRFGGQVAKYMGDGLLVYFGYPKAHDNDAARAVNAALNMKDAVQRLRAPRGECLTAHIGIHTGLVVAGEMGTGATHESGSVVGETPNVAARLEAFAGPGEILISQETKKLVEGLFTFKTLGPQKLKGIDKRLEVYRVGGQTEARNRFDVARQRGFGPLIGRDQEVALIAARWDRVCQGEGQVFLLGGEPGIGKSRIIQRICENVTESGGRGISYQCYANNMSSAFYPFIDEMERGAGVNFGDAADTRSEKLEVVIEDAASKTEAQVLCALLSLPSSQFFDEDPDKFKSQIYSALLGRIERLESEGPVCLVFEDFHWADPSSLEMLDRIIDFAREARMLVIVTFRPEFNPPWIMRPHATVLSLNRLDRKESRQIVSYQLINAELEDELKEKIVRRADGVPLFLEELTRAVIESSEMPVDTRIPATLDASLMARLDQLEEAKEVAQVGAVIGREFSVSLLMAALEKSAAELDHSLSTIVDSDLVYRLGGRSGEVFVFKHALVQDAAYNSLLKKSRERLHSRVADALGLDSEMRVRRPETIATHLTAAGRVGEAVDMWMSAGKKAQQRSADKEAVSHLGNGLSSVLKQTETSERDAKELEFRLALSPLLLATEGWGASETVESYSRARELCELLDARSVLPAILYGEYLMLIAKADFKTAYTTAVELLAVAEELDDDAGRIQGHRVLAWCSLYLGAFADAEKHAAQVLSLYLVDRHESVAFRYGYDPRVAGLSILAITCSIKNNEEAATKAYLQALEHANSLGHAGSFSYALMFAGALPAAMRGDRQMARELATELAIQAKKQKSPLWNSYADVILGWAVDNDFDDGTLRLKLGLSELSKSAPNPWQPLFLCLFGEMQLRSGDASGALHTLEKAHTTILQTNECCWEAEIYRLKGLALFAAPDKTSQQAEEWISKARKTAKELDAFALVERAENELAKFRSD